MIRFYFFHNSVTKSFRFPNMFKVLEIRLIDYNKISSDRNVTFKVKDNICVKYEKANILSPSSETNMLCRTYAYLIFSYAYSIYKSVTLQEKIVKEIQKEHISFPIYIFSDIYIFVCLMSKSQ